MFKQFISSKKHSQDCVIRAMMVATGWTWEQVFNALVPICLKLKDVPNSDAVYKKFFSTMGWEAKKVEKIEDDYDYYRMRFPTIREFAAMHRKGTYIITIQGHMVCIKDGDWYDVWDCSGYKVRKYWVVNENTDWDYYNGLFNKKSKK